MTPDYSFALLFPADARGEVLGTLAQRCTSETAAALEALRHSDVDASAQVVLQLPSDPALAQWRAETAEMHVGEPPDCVRLGCVQVWVEAAADARMKLTLWPLTRRMQAACVRSPEVRRLLVTLLVAHRGISCMLDHGDGSMTELWPQDEGVT
jgi:hypothetical protein